MLIILDLGANDGCSIIKFKKIIEYKKIKDYRIYSFEPHPFFNKYLSKLEENDKNVVFIQKLIGINNNVQRLYLSQESDGGSSIYYDKMTNYIDKRFYILCETIDIVEFFDTLPVHDELWLKMDIEGAEYEIIPYLKENNCLNSIDKLFIEWHYDKIDSITIDKHTNVYNMVKLKDDAL